MMFLFFFNSNFPLCCFDFVYFPFNLIFILIFVFISFSVFFLLDFGDLCTFHFELWSG